EAANFAELVVEAPRRLPVEAQVVAEEADSGVVLVGSRELVREAQRNRGRVGARLVDDEDVKTGAAAHRGQLRARRGARGQRRRDLAREPSIEAFRVTAGDPD